MKRNMLVFAVVLGSFLSGACHSRTTTHFGPDPVLPVNTGIDTAPNDLPGLDGQASGVTAELLSFSPAKGSKITTLAPGTLPDFPAPGQDFCAANRCFSWQVRVCNNTDAAKFVRFFLSSDGAQNMAALPRSSTVSPSECKIMGIDKDDPAKLFFPPGSRYLVAAALPMILPGWDPSWPRFVWDLEYHE